MNLFDVLKIPRLQHRIHPHLQNIGRPEFPVVRHLFDARPCLRDQRQKCRQRPRPITDRRGDSAQPPFRRKPPLNHPADHRQINIPPAQTQHHLLPTSDGRFITAPSGAAPAPSTTVFSNSSNRSTDVAICTSSISTSSSTTSLAI